MTAICVQATSEFLLSFSKLRLCFLKNQCDVDGARRSDFLCGCCVMITHFESSVSAYEAADRAADAIEARIHILSISLLASYYVASYVATS